jgi:hypothetical protein
MSTVFFGEPLTFISTALIAIALNLDGGNSTSSSSFDSFPNWAENADLVPLFVPCPWSVCHDG